jgi:hypothetical protein
MKKLIKNILNDVASGQVNLESKAAQDMIVNLIMDGIKSGKGWYLDLGSHGKDNLDTAGHEIEKINDYLVRDIKSVKTIDSEEKLYTVVANLGWDAKDKKQMIIGKISESEYEWLIGEK